MSRWEPKDGDAYYFVCENGNIDNTSWINCHADKILFNHGNVFRCEADAEIASKKIKMLLLNLHEPTTDCSQSPKLTAEVFDRPDCPGWAKYAAVGYGGGVSVFSIEPCISPSGVSWCLGGIGKHKALLLNADNSDWQNSLIKRHVKENELPDWCKPGAWVWSNNFGFFLITSIKDGAIKGECPGYSEIFMDYHFEDLKEAYLRPFDNEEMKNLVGKILVNKETKDINLVTDYINEVDEDDPSYHYCTVYVGGENMVATDLLEDFTIDGYPCGQLERKDNHDDNF